MSRTVNVAIDAMNRTAEAYAAAFDTEREQSYPAIDAFEARMGAMVDRDDLVTAARVLACPVKAHPPNWQHGRVLYAAARHALEGAIRAGLNGHPVTLLDIGTAKGFSALVLRWALRDAGIAGRVISLDVIDPFARVRRNTVAEVEGYKTLAETLAPWREAQLIEFVQSDSRAWLTAHTDRIHVAYVDGKHTYEAVSWDAALLAGRQKAGDLTVFDDVQIPGVAKAVRELRSYTVEYLAAKPERCYAIARRR